MSDTPHILVVDDEPEIRDMLDEYLVKQWEQTGKTKDWYVSFPVHTGRRAPCTRHCADNGTLK